MKRLFVTLSAIVMVAMVSAAPQRQLLHEGWQFKQVRGTNWFPATVPGVVHTDLMANSIIEDPFFQLNERGVQWVDKEDWEYVTTFEADKELLTRSASTLSSKDSIPTLTSFSTMNLFSRQTICSVCGV